jgi:hypothetical protein
MEAPAFNATMWHRVMTILYGIEIAKRSVISIQQVQFLVANNVQESTSIGHFGSGHCGMYLGRHQQTRNGRSCRTVTNLSSKHRIRPEAQIGLKFNSCPCVVCGRLCLCLRGCPGWLCVWKCVRLCVLFVPLLCGARVSLAVFSPHRTLWARYGQAAESWAFPTPPGHISETDPPPLFWPIPEDAHKPQCFWAGDQCICEWADPEA